MLCFRDTTFCAAPCSADPCPFGRRITDDLKAEAERWWGKPGAPIAVGDFSEMCPSFQRKETES